MTYETGGIFGMNLGDKSSMSYFTETAQKHHKVKVIDWAESHLFQMVLDGDIELNPQNSNKFFKPEEIDYIVHMMKKRYRDFKTTDMLTPFFKKGKSTLKLLMESLEIGDLYGKVDMNYGEITLEN